MPGPGDTQGGHHDGLDPLPFTGQTAHSHTHRHGHRQHSHSSLSTTARHATWHHGEKHLTVVLTPFISPLPTESISSTRCECSLPRQAGWFHAQATAPPPRSTAGHWSASGLRTSVRPVAFEARFADLAWPASKVALPAAPTSHTEGGGSRALATRASSCSSVGGRGGGGGTRSVVSETRGLLLLSLLRQMGGNASELQPTCERPVDYGALSARADARPCHRRLHLPQRYLAVAVSVGGAVHAVDCGRCGVRRQRRGDGSLARSAHPPATRKDKVLPVDHLHELDLLRSKDVVDVRRPVKVCPAREDARCRDSQSAKVAFVLDEAVIDPTKRRGRLARRQKPIIQHPSHKVGRSALKRCRHDVAGRVPRRKWSGHQLATADGTIDPALAAGAAARRTNGLHDCRVGAEKRLARLW
eukprot:2332470-Prymnesium_polylepis.1